MEAVGNTHFTAALSTRAGCCEASARASHFIKVVLRRSQGKYRTPQHHARTCMRKVPLAAMAVSETDTAPTQRIVIGSKRAQLVWQLLYFLLYMFTKKYRMRLKS
jgi:hypothetical protein